MGLDMSAGWLDTKSDSTENVFEWRKHAQLHEFMRQLWYKRKDEEAPYGVMGCEFNCEVMYLDKEDILQLRELVTNGNLPEAKDGFFWGTEFQYESSREYLEQDLNFCNVALEKLDEENTKVWYNCWW